MPGGSKRDDNAAWLRAIALKEPDNLSAGQPSHPFRRRLLRQPRHRHDVATLRHDEPRAGGRTDFIHMDPESAWTSQLRRIIGERILRLRHTHRRIPEAN